MKAYGIDHYNQALTMDVCQTLKRVQGGDDIPLVMLVFEDQGGGGMSWNQDELSPTLRAETHGHLPIVVIKNDESSYRNTIRKVGRD